MTAQVMLSVPVAKWETFLPSTSFTRSPAFSPADSCRTIGNHFADDGLIRITLRLSNDPNARRHREREKETEKRTGKCHNDLVEGIDPL
jgi:hypothetical protein